MKSPCPRRKAATASSRDKPCSSVSSSGATWCRRKAYWNDAQGIGEKPTGMTVEFARLSQRNSATGWRPKTKKPSRALILAKWGGTVSAPQSAAIMLRMIPLWTMSAAPWFSALGGWA